MTKWIGLCDKYMRCPRFRYGVIAEFELPSPESYLKRLIISCKSIIPPNIFSDMDLSLSSIGLQSGHRDSLSPIDEKLWARFW